jgi:hypothetical protein
MQKEQLHQGNTLLIQSQTKKQPYRKPDAVKLLELLIFKAKRKKYPNIPIDYMAPVTFRDDTANALTKCIVSFIQLKGGQAERITTAGRQIDISGTIAEYSINVEVNVEDNRNYQSQSQKDYQQAIESARGIYFIAQDFTSFLQWYNSIFE